ncbi:MAG TPA: hypothetical protein VNE62_04300 [Actinomycetota bacterium]|nr:hypothetical protein [Actinomycetota bacterium]
MAETVIGRAPDDRVLRVAVTGITASGKSSIATALTEAVNAAGVFCLRLPVDGFHNPREVRYRRGRESAEGYYRDAYDYDSLIRHVLRPLGPGGDCTYVQRTFDLEAETSVWPQPMRAERGSIAVLDASFLLRPEIRDLFDYRVFVHTSFEVAEQRGVERDQAALGGPDEARRLYRQRYHEAQRIYFSEAQPWKHADALVVNEYPEQPILFFRSAATKP